MTLGSMVMFDAAKLVQNFAEALRQTGQRGIVVEGWSEVPSFAASDRLFRVREIPYDWLFARVCCVVHHGGCGTVAAVLRAGQPSVIVPQVFCQEEFGRILLRNELATAVLDSLALRPQDLAAALPGCGNQHGDTAKRGDVAKKNSGGARRPGRCRRNRAALP